MTQISRLLRRCAAVKNCERGSIAMVLGLSIVPLIVVAGIAVDYTRGLNVKTELQSATDAAALAAARFEAETGSSSSSAWESYSDHMARSRALVNKVLTASLAGRPSFSSWSAVVRAGDKGVTVTTSAQISTTLAGLISDAINVTVNATAQSLGNPASLCMLGLNASAADTVKFWGTAELRAPDCAVQSNSINTSSLVTGGTATAEANVFCSAGGVAGTGFTPEAETQCEVLDDPYAGKYTPSALSAEGITLFAGCNEMSNVRVRNDMRITPPSTTQGYSFCGGATIQSGATLTLDPGIYVIFNSFDIMGGGSVVASPGVTLYFAGPSMVSGTREGVLTVQGGGNLTLMAPSTGPLAGMAIIQTAVDGYTDGSTPALTHTIIGGGTIDIVGIVYTPQAKVRITGNGVINANSDYFGIVSDFVELEGNGVLEINSGDNAAAYGMPEMDANGAVGNLLLVE